MSGLSYLQEQATAFPAEEEHFTQLSELYKDKLWFQLTEKLLQLLSVPHFQQPPNLITLYNEFIKGFQKDLNKLDLAQFAIAASKQCDDVKSSMKFLEDIHEIVKDSSEAETLCKMEKVAQMIQAGNLDDCPKLLEEGKKAMDDYNGIMDPAVHSAYYKSMFDYNKVKKDPQNIFRNALLYLSYTPVEKIPEADRANFAYDVSMAAVAGERIFNFGELLERPLVKTLGDSKYSWTLELLDAFNTGDIKAYERIAAEYRSSQVVLAENQDFLAMKVRILRLMDLIFSRPSQERAISFKEIAGTCDLKLEQVEFLVMKAFSLGVLKGMIDQVAETVTVTWVKPRVLSIDQIKGMSKRLKAWSEEVQKATGEVEDHSSEILAH